MAAKCSTSMSLCALRLTRLNPVTGFLAAGPNNSYQTTQTISLGFEPVLSEGEDREMRGSGDCVIVQCKAPDILKRWNFTLTMGAREPGLEEMLTGGAAITDNAGTPNVIGANFPAPLACGQLQPAVAIEAWTKAVVDDAQRGDLPWIRWVWPYAIWSPGGGTLEQGFQQPSFTGSSKSNPSLNLDAVYNDYPAGVVVGPHGGWFHDTFKPDGTACQYATASSS
jgi:hypothetical protein